LDVGTEEDRQRYIKNILTGDEIWCQGFSEPDHGSDLGNVQTKAVRDGDEYIVNGSKIWTTLGNYADHMILLARTDNTTARKYDGLSFFLSPMRVQGIEARPIRKVTGEYGFNETFFTDARIPAACLLGDEGGGWRMAMKTLEYERGVIAGQASAHSMQSIGLEDLMDAMQDFERDGAPILQDAMIRDELVKLAIEAKANSISDRRAAIPALNTDHPFGIALSNKYRHTEYARRLKMMGAHVQGPQGALFMDDDQSYKGGFWQRAYFANFGTTIGGGTTQIQANIIGEHVLGLPKS
ncbi:MAG: acyl-CoA dehydrogenase, partial [Halieaceae bacterium]|nr:acyl-CoA dehydrogenase [Halieaceae bacterium]